MGELRGETFAEQQEQRFVDLPGPMLIGVGEGGFVLAELIFTLAEERLFHAPGGANLDTSGIRHIPRSRGRHP